MKQIIKKSSILTIALIAGIGAATACSSAGKNESNKADVGTASNAAPANDKSNAENKVAVNKPAETQAKMVEVYDGRKVENDAGKTTPVADTKIVESEFKRSEAAIQQKLGDKYCIDPKDAKVEVYNSVEGAFTKPNAKEKAYLYSLCELGRGFGVGGIMIAENETVTAHYVGQISWSEQLSVLPDINQNGISEIVSAGGGSGQGYTESSIEILEFKAGNLDFLGTAETYSDNSGAMEDESKVLTTAYNISAQPGAAPVFFRETYEKKGAAKTWSLSKKSEKFSLKKEENSGFTKIN